MIEFDETAGRMVLKLVYYGPALSGKTTNLLRLHDQIEGKGRGDLMVLDTTDDRTIFFDLLPFFLRTPTGLAVKVKLYTVPGQVKHDATRKAVLQRADGVAFIADSRTAEQANNAFSFENLEKNLSLVGLDIDTLPLVVQFNKRDLSDVVPEEEIRRIWEPTGIPVFLASALKGEGVVETFTELLRRVYRAVDRIHRLAEVHSLSEREFISRITGIGEEP